MNEEESPMTDRAAPRWATLRTVVATLAVAAVLVCGGLWFSEASERTSTVSKAPKTAAAQKARAAEDEPTEIEDSEPRQLPGVRECGVGTPAVRPESIILNCSNAGMVASGIKWVSYGAAGAEGSGVVQVSGGANGAASASYPAKFRLYGAKNVDGKMAFTGLEVEYTGATRVGDQTEIFSIA
ncbi:hypothetical protein WEB32_12870 [Streptomyces netropsis]|uniref:Uncharacterized protein n=1 Tax=Streptomyces netropsis TaxID=55404 RepID=A0A7W7PAY9_STRNE|nr:hypothetical protein [Streptomyces netropsis]MBB4884061.1 hypothetical protein [Streptomyces netropsis]